MQKIKIDETQLIKIQRSNSPQIIHSNTQQYNNIPKNQIKKI